MRIVTKAEAEANPDRSFQIARREDHVEYRVHAMLDDGETEPDQAFGEAALDVLVKGEILTFG